MEMDFVFLGGRERERVCVCISIRFLSRIPQTQIHIQIQSHHSVKSSCRTTIYLSLPAATQAFPLANLLALAALTPPWTSL